MNQIIIQKNSETTFCFPESKKITCEVYALKENEASNGVFVERKEKGYVRQIFSKEFTNREPSNIFTGDSIKFAKEMEVGILRSVGEINIDFRC